MMRAGGAEVGVAGFFRARQPTGEGVALGRTADGRMVQRALAVAGAMAMVARRVQPLGAPDVIVARNLEMLALARRLAARREPRPRIVYELLDIHRLMLGETRLACAMRALERQLCSGIDLVLASSPGFLRGYFDRYYVTDAPICLIENKVLEVKGVPHRVTVGARPTRAAGEPLTIGWFGILRCQESLACLDAMTRLRPGRFRVVLRGKPDLLMVPAFHATIEDNPDLVFGGPYRSPEDLPALYGGCDLAWVIDRMDAGANSDWLLPNRLYEGCRFGAVPLALGGTETARFLAMHGVGATVTSLAPEAVAMLLEDLDASRLVALRRAVEAVPRRLWIADEADCQAIVGLLREPSRAGSQPVLSSAESTR
jgi:succinoglycan biosynthesis protein ExoL